MNHGMIRLTLGRLLYILSALLILPLFVAVIYRESLNEYRAFALTIALTLLSAFLLSWKRPQIQKIYAREGYVICALSWLLLSFFGALPFFFSAYMPNFVDALFETASGFTTTGSSVIPNIELFPHSLIFWRSFTHLIGGMGVLVFVVAILPNAANNPAHVNVLKAEIPGPSFGKIMPKIKNMTRVLYLIYLGMTLIVVILLCLGGMNLFDSLVHAFGIAGTGGMSSKAASIGAFNSAYIEYVVGISLIAFGINFNLYYLLLLRQFKAFYKNEELRWYLLIMAGGIGLICWNLLPYYPSFAACFRDVFFNVTSLMTSAGFGTVDFTKWPQFSQVVLVLLTLVGACAGSTAGGIKVYRIIVLVKTFKAEVIRVLSPNRIHHIQVENKALQKDKVYGIYAYFVLYIFVFMGIMLIVSHDSPDFATAFGATLATFNNIGPNIGHVGPAENFAFYDNISKLALTFSMIAGRLEILPILLCMSPRVWRKG